LDYDETPSSSSSSPRRYQSQTPKLTPNSQIDEDQTPSHRIKDLSTEYSSKSNGIKEVPLNHEPVGDKRNSVNLIAASFNVRPPGQNSRESTPKVQRTTVEVRPPEEPPRQQTITVNVHANDQPAKGRTPELPKNNASPKEQHSRTDSGVDSQEYAPVAVPPPEPEIDYESNAIKKAAAKALPKPGLPLPY
jgi:hypothetical protein